MTHDDKRHGTTTLFAGLNVLTGTVIGHNAARHRHQEFLRFLTGARPSGGRRRPAVLRAAWRGPIPGAAQAVRTAAQAGQGWVAS